MAWGECMSVWDGQCGALWFMPLAWCDTAAVLCGSILRGSDGDNPNSDKPEKISKWKMERDGGRVERSRDKWIQIQSYIRNAHGKQQQALKPVFTFTTGWPDWRGGGSTVQDALFTRWYKDCIKHIINTLGFFPRYISETFCRSVLTCLNCFTCALWPFTALYCCSTLICAA